MDWQRQMHGHPPWPTPAADHSVPLLLGQLLQHASHTARGIDKIEARLEQGAARMDRMTDEIRALQQAQAAARVGPLERWIKDALVWLLPLGVLLATGNLDMLAGLVEAVTKLHAAR